MSLRFQRPVAELLRGGISVSFRLAFFSLILSALLAWLMVGSSNRAKWARATALAHPFGPGCRGDRGRGIGGGWPELLGAGPATGSGLLGLNACRGPGLPAGKPVAAHLAFSWLAGTAYGYGIPATQGHSARLKSHEVETSLLIYAHQMIWEFMCAGHFCGNPGDYFWLAVAAFGAPGFRPKLNQRLIQPPPSPEPKLK